MTPSALPSLPLFFPTACLYLQKLRMDGTEDEEARGENKNNLLATLMDRRGRVASAE